ncbi:MAG: M20/M25/M40 family metallo-hydrolase [Bacteroidales bacterium]|nr:M20/M25/M40 family metallo-hydrolase [Bacteroidales bacterium]
MKTTKAQFLSLILIIFFLPVFSQTEKVDLETIYKIKQQGLKNSKIKELSFYMTDYVGPRLPNSPTGRHAQKVAQDKMNEYGLSNVHTEVWGEFGRGWDNQKTYIAMTAPYYSVMIGTPKAWTAGTNGLVKAPVMLVNIEDESDFEIYKGKLDGKIALMSTTREYKVSFEKMAKRYTDEELEELTKESKSGGRRGNYTDADIARWRKMRKIRNKLSSFLMQEGAIATLSSSGYFGVPMGSGSSAKTDAPPTIPAILLTGEHHGRMVRLIQHEVAVEVEMDIKNEFLSEDLNDYNVIGEIPGTDKKLKDEVVMIGAHLDSWHMGTGANDNASGCIVMIEAMRILKSIGVQPKRTIRIALWGSEEQGLNGSRGYVKEHFGDPKTMELKPEHAKLSAYYNVDNGSGMIRGIYLQENDMLEPVFKAWLEPFSYMGASTITLRNTGGTDHLSFNSIGLNGFQFIQDPIDYRRGYHTNMDTYERLMMDDMKHNAVIVAAIIYHTAMRDELLARKPLPVKK